MTHDEIKAELLRRRDEIKETVAIGVENSGLSSLQLCKAILLLIDAIEWSIEQADKDVM